MSRQKIEIEASNLLGFLRSITDDRGAMANLLCLFTPARASLAWPLLARAGALAGSRKQTVAGLYALHPKETKAENFGHTCRKLKRKHNTFESRFQRLLACDREEVIVQ